MANLISNANSGLNDILSTPYVTDILKLILLLYASVVAPQLPTKISSWFTNSYVRLAFFALILILATHDIGLSIILTLAYFVTLAYFNKNAVNQIATTGKVTPEVTVVINSSGTTAQTQASMQQAVNSKMNNSNATTFATATQAMNNLTASSNTIANARYITPPEATLTSGQANTAATPSLSNIPSNVSSNSASMMAHTTSSEVSAFTPYDVENLAQVPNKNNVNNVS